MEKGPRTEPSGSNLTSSDTDDASRTPTNHSSSDSASQPEMKLLKDEIIGERREEGEEVRVVVGGGGGLATSLSSAMAIAGAEQRAAGDGGASPPFGLGLPRREITATTISCELLWTPGKQVATYPLFRPGRRVRSWLKSGHTNSSRQPDAGARYERRTYTSRTVTRSSVEFATRRNPNGRLSVAMDGQSREEVARSHRIVPG
ncbi:hypothetical protein BHE74_00032209 [Ensete ventricosum]|nr:hypothetical protein BHE74_00032209 [Ensete ventricosum]